MSASPRVYDSSRRRADGAELLVRYAAEDDYLEVGRTSQRQLTETVSTTSPLITYAGDVRLAGRQRVCV